MPMVNLEALACGTPVAVFNTGGCPEAVDESCGVVAPKGDAAFLGEAVKRLCDEKKRRRDACIARAANFDSRFTFQSYLRLYKELCS